VWERASEVGTINISTLLLWNIYVFTTRAVNLKNKEFSSIECTLTLEVLNSSDIPIGKTACLSQRTLGQTPNLPKRNFSLIMAKPMAIRNGNYLEPLGERIKRAWMRP
jgi:hypothetical protein